MSNKLAPGSLCKIRLDGLMYTQDGFAMGGVEKDGLLLFSDINLLTYPSDSDFIGESSLVRHGDIAIIIKYVGRPDRITRDPKWFQYDVYRVFVNGNTRMIFRQNISPV